MKSSLQQDENIRHTINLVVSSDWLEDLQLALEDENTRTLLSDYDLDTLIILAGRADAISIVIFLLKRRSKQFEQGLNITRANVSCPTMSDCADCTTHDLCRLLNENILQHLFRAYGQNPYHAISTSPPWPFVGAHSIIGRAGSWDLNELDFDGLTPLMIACKHFDFEMIYLLISRDANVFTEFRDTGLTAGHFLAISP